MTEREEIREILLKHWPAFVRRHLKPDSDAPVFMKVCPPSEWGEELMEMLRKFARERKRS